ncbi:hypothetical protein FNF27_01857 [Cafeteria roenbergensis]|uniref:GPN-loop GTPase n=1 Tax=Cafeteria roenbergensis TaxID=33653 RepID=A0A5A8EFE4_CAFRO|nr:hypothetical protein FNF27_01857 [Cafeteria roenbergensis]
MAGSGKTTLMRALSDRMGVLGQVPYIINADPAVAHVPYVANIDIRDAVNYKEVMKQYGLGPNGAILTALNLFATKFDQVLELCKRRADEVSHVLVDTPGQIEAFTWSASGQIITESVASEMPTCVLFVLDVPRSRSPTTFMSNMLYACSILYKTRLPIVVVLNKTDVAKADDLVGWMRDFELFQKALDDDRDATYASTLTRSMSLALDEFYAGLEVVPVSAATGDGLDALVGAITRAATEFEEGYALEAKASLAARQEQAEKDRAASLARLQADVEGRPAPEQASGEAAPIGLSDAAGSGLRTSMGREVVDALESVREEGGAAARTRGELMREAPALGVFANGRRMPGWEPSDDEVAAAQSAEAVAAIGAAEEEEDEEVEEGEEEALQAVREMARAMRDKAAADKAAEA